jgi:hypothetical protein
MQMYIICYEKLSPQQVEARNQPEIQLYFSFERDFLTKSSSIFLTSERWCTFENEYRLQNIIVE